MSIAQLLFGLQDRLRRRTYWLCVLGVMVWYFGVHFVLALSAGAWTGDRWIIPSATAGFLGLFLMAVWAAAAWMLIALTVKRLHDRNRFAWPHISALLLTFVLWALFAKPLARLWPGGGLAALVPWLLVCLWILVEAIMDGTPDGNRFGPSPKARRVDASTFD